VRLLFERWEQCRSQLEHADDVGLNDGQRREKIDSVGGEVFGPRDSGIVDENIELRVLSPDAGRKGVDFPGVFDVESHATHAGVGSGDLVEETLTAAGDDDLIAAPMESLSEGAADTAGTASEENGPSG
jgi:hypothetical protein